MKNKAALFGSLMILIFSGCSLPDSMQKTENKTVPTGFQNSNDSSQSKVAVQKWKAFFTDPNLIALIDTALQHNQELNIVMQEISIAKNEVRARKGEYLPSLGIGGGAGLEKAGRYTRTGAVDENVPLLDGKKIPNPMTDMAFGAQASWEIDIWKKLRNSKKAAAYRYLASTEGKNFMVTNLVAEIASSYYDLVALDNQLEILQQNITIQQNALAIVKMQKVSAKVTELAVRKFEAEVLKNQSRLYDIKQQIVEAENEINFLVGRFPQPVTRTTETLVNLFPDPIKAGLPSQLLENRPDIRQAEMQLVAAKLDVKAAKANFYPSLNIKAGLGYQAFNPTYLITTPASLVYSVSGDLMAPLVNRNAIKAAYYTAGSKQVQAAYEYEKTILNAFVEVSNQLANMDNLAKSYEFKEQQVKTLTESIDISTVLFKSARADYMEVLMTQRDALEARFELVETKKEQFYARVNMYKALGGGWQ